MNCAVCIASVPSDAFKYEFGAVQGHLCADCHAGFQIAVSRWLSDRMSEVAAEQRRAAQAARSTLRKVMRDERARKNAERLREQELAARDRYPDFAAIQRANRERRNHQAAE